MSSAKAQAWVSCDARILPSAAGNPIEFCTAGEQFRRAAFVGDDVSRLVAVDRTERRGAICDNASALAAVPVVTGKMATSVSNTSLAR